MGGYKYKIYMSLKVTTKEILVVDPQKINGTESNQMTTKANNRRIQQEKRNKKNCKTKHQNGASKSIPINNYFKYK